MNNNFYELVAARLIASQQGHDEKVAQALDVHTAVRRKKAAAKARRRRVRMSPEQKKAASARKMEQARANHGDDYYAKVGKAYRNSVRGMRYCRQYNHSEEHLAAVKAYQARKKLEDPEGYARQQKVKLQKYRAKIKLRALWQLMLILPPDYFQGPPAI